MTSRRQPPMVLRMIRSDAPALRFARGVSPSLMALAFAAGLSGPALAQTQAQTAPGAPIVVQDAPPVQAAAAPQEERLVINRILVRGAQRIDQTTILSYLPIQPGDVVDAAVLDV